MAYPITNEAMKLFTAPQRQIVRISFSGQEEDMTITDEDVVQGGCSVNRYCISGRRIEIGSAIAGELTLTLNNSDGKFNDVLFEGAELYVRIGTKDWNAGEDAPYYYISLGYFTVDEAPRKLETITLTALDRMVLFDKNVDMSLLTFPRSVGGLLADICSICNVTLGTAVQSLHNSTYVIEQAPESDNLTYRQILSWIAEITGTCGFVDWEGHLILKWYEETDTKITTKERFSSDIDEKSITITGVQIVTDEGTILVGTDDYVINIESNELIQHDADEVAQVLYSVLGGFTYTPFSATVQPMPHLYPLDRIIFVDKHGTEHPTVVTDTTFTLNRNTVLAGQGETAEKSGHASANPLTKREKAIINKLKKEQNKTLSDRIQFALSFNEMIGNALGLYYTALPQDDGSTKHYLHNRPVLEESTVIYTMTEGGIAWTDTGWNDGNPVWSYGVTSAGDALFKMLAAEKILAEWIKVENKTITEYIVENIDGVAADVNGAKERISSLEVDMDGVRSSISETDRIVREVSEADKDFMETFEETVSSMINQKADSITFDFEKTTLEINDRLTNFKDQFDMHIRFSDDGIELGDSNGFSALLGTQELSFTEKRNRVAYISNNRLYITYANAVEQTVGGRFRTYVDSNGHLCTQLA